MAGDNPDTDPSTPAARTARGDTDPDPNAPVAAASTDPGLGPPPSHAPPPPPKPPPPPPSRRAPPVPQAMNDSVEMLLDGIVAKGAVARGGESRGEASAAYQGVGHRPPTARKTPVPEPPVIVKRREMPPTVRLDRAAIDAAVAANASKRLADTTVVVPRTQGPRVVAALLAAIVVVLAVFMGMKAWSAKLKRDAMAADPVASQLVTAPLPSAWRPAQSATQSTLAPAPPPPPTTATATTASAPAATTAAPPTPPKPARSHAPGAGSGSSAGSGGTDLGEFKPTINH